MIFKLIQFDYNEKNTIIEFNNYIKLINFIKI